MVVWRQPSPKIHQHLDMLFPRDLLPHNVLQYTASNAVKRISVNRKMCRLELQAHELKWYPIIASINKQIKMFVGRFFFSFSFTDVAVYYCCWLVVISYPSQTKRLSYDDDDAARFLLSLYLYNKNVRCTNRIHTCCCSYGKVYFKHRTCIHLHSEVQRKDVQLEYSLPLML